MTKNELIDALTKLDIEFMVKKENTYSDEQRGNLVTVRFWCEDMKEG